MKTILMVDDVTTNLICASQVLRSSYEVSTAKSGKQALLMLKEMTPDLIMLDINMPQMDGYEVFKALQDNPEWASIPVVFLTAESDMTKEIKGLEMGAMDFIRKPFDPDVMKARIDKILSLSEQRKKLEGAANMDSLTGLSTRKGLEKLIESSEGREGYFLLLDLDNFKAVNDTYGHVVGDSVLIKMARIFEEIVEQKERICRLGGDEFAIFLKGELERDEVRTIARRLIATAEFEINELVSDFNDFKVSISIGISNKPGDALDFQTLYSDADKALYYVKQNGKRGYHFFDSMSNKGSDVKEDDAQINLMQLQRLIHENDEKTGAYKVEYEGFKRIYRFVARCMERKNQDVQIVLFSLDVKDNQIPNEKYIEELGEAISLSLRRGDVAAQCGETQYVVILVDANEENGTKVVKRIQNRFCKGYAKGSVELNYEIESVSSNAE